MLHVILKEWPYPFIDIHGGGVLTALFGCCMAGAKWNAAISAQVLCAPFSHVSESYQSVNLLVLSAHDLLLLHAIISAECPPLSSIICMLSYLVSFFFFFKSGKGSGNSQTFSFINSREFWPLGLAPLTAPSTNSFWGFSNRSTFTSVRTQYCVTQLSGGTLHTHAQKERKKERRPKKYSRHCQVSETKKKQQTLPSEWEKNPSRHCQVSEK